jgi:hypothetical protein
MSAALGRQRADRHDYRGSTPISPRRGSGSRPRQRDVEERRRLTRGRLHLVAGTESETAGWGGGWFTDLTARLNVRVAERTSLAVAYGGRGEGWLFDRRAYTDERRRIVAGVTYAR